MKHGIRLAAALLLISLLTACGRSPRVTAEGLIDGAESKKPAGSTVTGTIAYDLSVVMNLSDVADQPVYMRTQLKGAIEVKGDDSVCYMKSQVGASIMGVSDTSVAEQWTEIRDDGTALSYYSEDGEKWILRTEKLTVSGNPPVSSLLDIFELKSSDFTGLRLMSSGDGGYAVTGMVDGRTIEEKFGSLDDLSGGLGNTGGMVEVTMLFTGEGECRSVVYDFAPGQEDEDTDVEAYRFGVNIESYSDEKMEIPAEVLEGSVGQEGQE